MSQAILNDYIGKIEAHYKRGIATEHTYRGVFQTLLELLDTRVTATNEPKRVKCGAPDYVVERNNLTIGYIEAKDIGKSLDEIEKDDQLKRYRHALENLILTDYLGFRWYVNGEKRMEARLAKPGKDRKLTLDRTGAKEVEALLRSFLEHSAEPINKPQDLAKRMARLAHMIRDVIVEAFARKDASDTLWDLYTAFQEVLLPALTEAEFADMFAQTLAYGLFAARYNHKGKKPFGRSDAAKEIPRTNPFLRKLFGTIAGPDLEDEPFVGFVDELAQALAYTDMDAILADFGKRTHQDDPMVHFYETFLTQYDPKLRELRGVYYTPDPVVSYIVRSVDSLLHSHFDLEDGLADTSQVRYSYQNGNGHMVTEEAPAILLLDPACGTSTFLYHVIHHIRESFRAMGNAGMWQGYVRDHLLPRIFGFELLMAPYAMAHLKLGMQLAAVDLPVEERKRWAYTFGSDERLGIYLTNTLDEARKRSEVLFGRYISEEANEAAKVKQQYPVMVILGNPPYSGHSANKGEWINNLLRGKDTLTGFRTENYFEVDGQPLQERNPKYLNDDYVKFIRFAQWRIQQTGYGILAFITNHGYLGNPTFRGMRQSLMKSFDDIYILNLRGNSKKRERPPDGLKDENVFDIQQGVAIGIFVKRQNSVLEPEIHYMDLWGTREIFTTIANERYLTAGKYHWLAEYDVSTTPWTKFHPPFYRFIPQNVTLQSEYNQAWKITDIFLTNSTGVKTHRDHFVVDFDALSLRKRIEDFRDLSISKETIIETYKLQDTRDWKLGTRRRSLASNSQWETFFTKILYRPFDVRNYFHHEDVVELPRNEIMRHMQAGNNIALATTRSIEIGRGWEHMFCTSGIIQHHAVSLKEVNYIFPLYLYPPSNQISLFEDSSATTTGNRRSNLSQPFIKAVENKLGLRFNQDGDDNLQSTFSPEDIFSYAYAFFYSPTYRERYAEYLKIDFPRLPLTSNIDLFRKLCSLGESLVSFHLLKKGSKISTRFPVSGTSVIDKITYTCDSRESEKARVWINKEQYFEGVPPEVWEFSIGGYQVCEKWLKDRKGRILTFDDIQHYQKMIAVLAETINLTELIDDAIDGHGGWPLQ